MEKINDFPVNEPRYLKFAKLFNQEKFFEAHEILETLWKELEGADRDFLKGLIQIAAAFVHIQRGTPQGACRLFETASRYLQKYPSPYKGINTHNFLPEVEKFLRAGRKGFPKITAPLQSSGRTQKPSSSPGSPAPSEWSV